MAAQSDRLRFIALRPICRGRVDGRVEVHAVEHLVDADEQQVVRRPVQHGQVVAGRDVHEVAPAAARRRTQSMKSNSPAMAAIVAGAAA